MEWVLNPSIELRGNKRKKEFTFYNGKSKRIKVKNFDFFAELFQVLQESNEKDVEDFLDAYRLSNTEFNELLNYLRRLNLIVKRSSISKKRIRNTYHFSALKNNDFISEKTPFSNQTVCILGCGTTGAEIAVSLAKIGVKEIIIMDKDIVEEKNIVAQHVYTWEDVGELKINALKKYLINSGLTTRIKTINDYVDENTSTKYSTLLKNVTCFVDCADKVSTSVRLALIKMAMSLKARYFFCGYGAEYGYLFQFSNYNLADLYLNKEWYLHNNEYSFVNNSGTITFSMLVAGNFLSILEEELLKNSYPLAIKVKINTRTLSVTKSSLIHEIIPQLYTEKELSFFVQIVTELKVGIFHKENFNFLKEVYLYLNILYNLDCMPFNDTKITESFLYLKESMNLGVRDSITRTIEEKNNVYNLYDYISILEEKYNKQLELNKVFSNLEDSFNKLLIELKNNYSQNDFSTQIIELVNNNQIATSVINTCFNSYLDYYKNYSNFLSLDEAFHILSLILSEKDYLTTQEMYLNNYLLIFSSLRNLENNTIYFSSKDKTIICVTYRNTMSDFFLLLHELGHLLLDTAKFDKLTSEKKANEFVLTNIQKILTCKSISSNMKKDIYESFLQYWGANFLLNWIILKTGLKLSTNSLKANIESYHEFRSTLDEKLQLSGITLKNSKIFYNNLLLAPHAYKNPNIIKINLISLLLKDDSVLEKNLAASLQMILEMRNLL